MRLILLPGQCAAYNLPFKESHKYALIVPGPKVNEGFNASPFLNKANLSAQVFLDDDLLADQLCFTDPESDSTDDCVIELYSHDNITEKEPFETESREIRIVICNVHNDNNKEDIIVDSDRSPHPKNASSVWQLALSKVNINKI